MEKAGRIEPAWLQRISSQLSNPTTIVAISLVYYVTLLLLSNYIRRRELKIGHTKTFIRLAACHNVVLSITSLLMNIQATSAIRAVVSATSWKHAVCTPAGRQLPTSFENALLIFQLSKIYEFLDTHILLLRGKSLTPLHVWHHSTVMFEVAGWLQFNVSLGVSGMWFNTFVHVVMYAYFAAALYKRNIPGKVIITISQIVQFITGFASLLPFAYLHTRTDFGPCEGVPGLSISSAINGSYLILFILFFRKTYKNSGKRTKVQ